MQATCEQKLSCVRLPWTDVVVAPEAGRAILVDGWEGHCSQHLEDCENPEFAAFRLPSGRYTDVAYACEIEVTGRVAQKRPYDGRMWVRVRITWVKDGEENTSSAGWMAV
jgi:hypothetical protein